MIHLNKLSKTIAINLFLVLFLSGGNARATSDTLSDKELISLFDYMHKEDQSHLRHLEIREHVFLSNFSELIRIIENQGYPQLKTVPKRRRHRYIIDRSSATILIHILQYKPHWMLTDEIIQLLDRELKSKRMPALVLEVPLTNMVGPDSLINRFDETIQQKFYEAKEIWGINFLTPKP